MMRSTSRYTEEDVAAINAVASFLALDDLGPNPAGCLPAGVANHSIDCIILAGNSVLETAEGAFRLMQAGACPRLLITGGIGHATDMLRRNVADDHAYRVIATQGRAEAHILADMAHLVWNIDPSRILIEAESTNSGENARFSRDLLEREGCSPSTFLIVQDPTMQRRADATFRHVWNDRRDVTFLNWPSFGPQVTLDGGGLQFASNDASGLWSMDHFLTLVMGEIPRLRDDSHGYGPKGRGFIVHVDIPEQVEAAYRHLHEHLADRFGGRSAAPP
jgi:uncharacterized SAM-binding protein YcdF (DUF218 family)